MTERGSEGAENQEEAEEAIAEVEEKVKMALPILPKKVNMETQIDSAKKSSDEKVMTLSQLQQNKIATVIAIDGCSKFQKQLLNLGIHKDKKIRMVASQLFSGPLTIEIDGKQISIGRGMASKIIVV